MGDASMCDSADGVGTGDPSIGDDRSVGRRVYTGTGRFSVCRDVSGRDCERTLAADAEHCGVEEHVRLRPHGVRRGEPRSRARRVARRPRLIVDEVYEVVSGAVGDDVSDGQFIETRLGVLDPSVMWVSIEVQRDVTAYHGVTPDEAIDNVRLVIRRAAETGRMWRTSGGFHRFWWSGFHVVVTPDLGTAVRYTTDHFERTPSEVDAGVKSRFRSRRRPAGEVLRPDIPEHFRVGDRLQGRVANIVNFGVFVDLGVIDGLVHKSRFGIEDGTPHGRVDIGDPIVVEILSIDRDLHRIELILAEAEDGPAEGGS